MENAAERRVRNQGVSHSPLALVTLRGWEESQGEEPQGETVEPPQDVEDETPDQRRKRLRALRWLGYAGVFILLLAVVARIGAPFAIKWWINDTIEEDPNYSGGIQDVELSVLGGWIEGKGLVLFEDGADKPIFATRTISIDYDWKPLLSGRIAADVKLVSPQLILTPQSTKSGDGTAKKEQDDAQTSNFALEQTAKDLLPATVRRVDIHDGRIVIGDATTNPDTTLVFSSVRIIGENISNSYVAAPELPAVVRARAVMQRSGEVWVRVGANLFADEPTFDLEAQLRGLQITELNDFARAYGGFDFETGTLDFAAEIVAAEGKIRGYVKPSLKGAQVWTTDSDDGGFWNETWEATVDAGKWVLENDNDAVAARVSFNGNFSDPDTSAWTVVTSLLGNAFIEAILPNPDNSVDITTLF